MCLFPSFDNFFPNFCGRRYIRNVPSICSSFLTQSYINKQMSVFLVSAFADVMHTPLICALAHCLSEFSVLPSALFLGYCIYLVFAVRTIRKRTGDVSSLVGIYLFKCQVFFLSPFLLKPQVQISDFQTSWGYNTYLYVWLSALLSPFTPCQSSRKKGATFLF